MGIFTGQLHSRDKPADGRRPQNRVGSGFSFLFGPTSSGKAIAGRYGGLENLGEKLMKSENFEMALDEIVWLLTPLANQSILIHNLKNKDGPEDLLTEEEVELLTSPLDLAAYKTPSPKPCSGVPNGPWRATTSSPAAFDALRRQIRFIAPCLKNQIFFLTYISV